MPDLTWTNEMILGYDLLNEPFLMGAPDVLDDFFAEVTRAVREVDTHHILFLRETFAMDSRDFMSFRIRTLHFLSTFTLRYGNRNC